MLVMTRIQYKINSFNRSRSLPQSLFTKKVLHSWQFKKLRPPIRGGCDSWWAIEVTVAAGFPPLIHFWKPNEAELSWDTNVLFAVLLCLYESQCRQVKATDFAQSASHNLKGTKHFATSILSNWKFCHSGSSKSLYVFWYISPCPNRRAKCAIYCLFILFLILSYLC